MTGQTVSIAAHDGGAFNAYLAKPESGGGPAVVILQEIFGVNAHIRSVCDRYAEEGYLAIAPDVFWRQQPSVELEYNDDGIKQGRALAMKSDINLMIKDIASTIAHVRTMPGSIGKVGVVGFCFGGRLAFLTAARTDVDAAICYYGGGIDQHVAEAASIKCPIMLHWGADDAGIPAAQREAVRSALASHDRAESYVYDGAGHGFNCDRRASYHTFAASLAMSRTLGLLHWTIGPRYDLSALWEQHTAHEFAEHDPDATMRTMVAQPYVNHVPTLTGGVGYDELHYFYAKHFLPRLPADATLIPITRTIGPNRVVDEFVVRFTHDREIDFMAPGIAATGKVIELPHVAVVEFRGNKIAHEHIHWDQASFLKQIGALDAQGLPIAGVESAKKFIDEKLPSNQMMPQWKRK